MIAINGKISVTELCENVHVISNYKLPSFFIISFKATAIKLC